MENIKGMNLKKFLQKGFGDRLSEASRNGTRTVFRNVVDGNLYHVYMVSPRLYTGSWPVAERIYYANGETKAIPQSHLKNYVVVAYH